MELVINVGLGVIGHRDFEMFGNTKPIVVLGETAAYRYIPTSRLLDVRENPCVVRKGARKKFSQ